MNLSQIPTSLPQNKAGETERKYSIKLQDHFLFILRQVGLEPQHELTDSTCSLLSYEA